MDENPPIRSGTAYSPGTERSEKVPGWRCGNCGLKFQDTLTKETHWATSPECKGSTKRCCN